LEHIGNLRGKKKIEISLEHIGNLREKIESSLEHIGNLRGNKIEILLEHIGNLRGKKKIEISLEHIGNLRGTKNRNFIGTHWEQHVKVEHTWAPEAYERDLRHRPKFFSGCPGPSVRSHLFASQRWVCGRSE
jgi:hypothetical protein